MEETLERLIERELVVRLDRRPGQKEERYAQLLGGEVDDAAASEPAAGARPRPARGARGGARGGGGGAPAPCSTDTGGRKRAGAAGLLRSFSVTTRSVNPSTAAKSTTTPSPTPITVRSGVVGAVTVGGDMLEPLQLLDRMPGEVRDLFPKLLRQEIGAVRDVTGSAH